MFSTPSRAPACFLLVLLATAGAAPAAEQRVPPAVTTSDGRVYDVTLDELWLTARTAPGGRVPPVVVPGARSRGTRGDFEIFALENVVGAPDLGQRLHALENANPGREAHLVVFERGAARVDGNRALLGREVALLLKSADAPVPESLKGLDVAPFPSVPGTFIVRAADPLAALDIVDKLRNDPAVLSSYPLLRRFRAAR
jgi:hypothetical protein